MKKKRIAIFMAGLRVAMALAGCGEGTEKRNSSKTVTESGKKENMEDAKERESGQETSTESTKAELQSNEETKAGGEPEEKEASYLIFWAYPFFEERAWVKFQDENKSYSYGLIDTDGNLLYSYPEDERGFEAKGLYPAEEFKVVDGVTCFQRKDGFVLLDAQGKELYKAVDTDTEEYGLAGRYFGYFLMYKRSASEKGKVQPKVDYYLIDRYGTEVLCVTKSVKLGLMRYEWSESEKEAYEKKLEEILVEYRRAHSISENTWKVKWNTEKVERGDYGSRQSKAAKLDIMDENGSLIFSIDSVTEFYPPAWDDDYIAVMINEDNNIYAAIYDRSGVMQYDPVYIDKAGYTYSCDISARQGFIFHNDWILKPDGTKLNWADDLSEIPMDAYLYSTSGGDLFWRMANGFIFDYDKYISLDRSKVIDRVRAVK